MNTQIMRAMIAELDRLVALDEAASEFFPTQPGLERRIGELRTEIARMADRAEGVRL